MTTPTEPALLVLLAVPDPALAALFSEALRGHGHRTATADSARQLAERCREHAPDVIVTELHLPDGPALPAVAAATRERRVPVVVLAADYPAQSPDVADVPVEAVLVPPVSPAGLRAAVALAARSFARDEALRAEVTGLRRQLEERKLIERAKGIVTRRLGVDEAEAFRRMRKLSSDRNLKLVEVARQIIECDEVFEELERSAGPGSRARP
jgi:response regulator NasT